MTRPKEDGFSITHSEPVTQPHYIDRLIGFAVHDDDCTVNRFPGHGACSCGLSVLIQEARHARRDAPMEAVAWRSRLVETQGDAKTLWKLHHQKPSATTMSAEVIREVQALAVIPTHGLGSSLRDTQPGKSGSGSSNDGAV